MKDFEIADGKNRRVDFRSECPQKSEFTCAARKRHRAEMLDVSEHGAKLITEANVKVGDFLRLAGSVVGQVCESTGTVVRWIKPLSGGKRRLVGVQTLRAAYAID